MSSIYGRAERAGIKGTVYRKMCCLPSHRVPRKLMKPLLKKTSQKVRRRTSTPTPHLAIINAPVILTIISTDSYHYEHLRTD